MVCITDGLRAPFSSNCQTLELLHLLGIAVAATPPRPDWGGVRAIWTAYCDAQADARDRQPIGSPSKWAAPAGGGPSESASSASGGLPIPKLSLGGVGAPVLAEHSPSSAAAEGGRD